MTPLSCPGCGDAMSRARYQRRPTGTVDLDLCHPCRAIWFDQYESTQLTPGAVIELFREIHAHAAAPTRPLAERPPCPLCRKHMVFTHDLQRTNRFTYYRCPDGHGRLTTFVQFLREKQFVRSLSPAEIERLGAYVAQVRCSSCGGPVKLEVDAQCPYCRAPIAVLDPEAVERTLAQLSQQERDRTRMKPWAARAALAGEGIPQARFAYAGGGLEPWGGSSALDLVGDVLGMMFGD